MSESTAQNGLDHLAPAGVSRTCATRVSSRLLARVGGDSKILTVGDDVTVQATGSTTPFKLTSGSQLLLQPQIGLELGP